MKYINEEIIEAANTIKSSACWTDCESEIRTLVEAAGMLEAYESANGETFESVIYAAADKLGVEVI